MNRVLNYLWPGIPDDQTPVGAEIRLRQFILVARSSTTISGANVINTLLTSFLFWNTLPKEFILIWAGISLLASSNHLIARYRHRDRPDPESIARRTILRSVLWTGMAGVFWGVIALAVAWQGTIVHLVFLAFVIAGQGAAAAVWMSPILASSYAFLWLSVAPLIIGLVSHGEPITAVLAFMALLFLLANFLLARNTHDDFEQSVKANLKLRELNERLTVSEQLYRKSEETLMTAIEAMDAGFVLYDADDRLVMSNSKYREYYKNSAAMMEPGTRFEDLLRHGMKIGIQSIPSDNSEEWIKVRLAEHAKPFSRSEQMLSDGRWLQVAERRTSDGSTVGFRFDITYLKQAQDDLMLARDEAEAASHAKSEFLSSMSHELRTPLNAILGFAQLLDTDSEFPLEKVQQESVAQILGGGRHLLDLIDQVLDLARIETGNITVSIEGVLLEDIFKDCLPLAETLASKRNVTLTRSAPDEDLAVMADTTRLKQVLLNLLSNAVKYNRQGGEVTLDTAVTDRSSIIIAISDTGEGIPEEKQALVFEPFNRLGAETSGVEGTGIGLTISRQLVQLMKGDIGFESTPGEGSTFWIELPVTTMPVLSDEAGVDVAIRRPTPAKSDDRVGGGGKLLYIEDNPANLRLMELIVDRIDGVTLLSAHTAELGLEMALTHSPDLIFMDISLPGMDGFEAVELLKSDPATKGIPVVAVSAKVTTSDIERGRQAGFMDYISKPLQVDQMLDLVNGIINSETV